MMITDSDLSQYINFPIESFNLETKAWIDSKSEKGIAKIVKACIALRNSNGGKLIVGISDNKEIDEENYPKDVFADFEQDYIQGLISKYASIPFEIEVRFAKKNQFNLPVIIIPSGFKTPVAIKKELKIDGNKTLLKLNSVYVRTLSANNVVSSSEATSSDWERLMGLCFDNRESDIGQFIRRHLTPENISLLSKQIGEEKEPLKDPSNLNLGYSSFEQAMKSFSIEMPDKGFFEVSFKINGQVEKTYEPDQNFLNLITTSNRRLTGWPFWLDSRGFPEQDATPYVLNYGWEALIPSEYMGKKIDFWRMSPNGHFYAIRSLDDDSGSKSHPKPKTVLDPYLVICRVAEVLTLSVAFAKAMSYVDENSKILCNFRWRGLEDRQLSNWSSNDFMYLSSTKARQNIVETNLTLPTDTPDNSIFQYVEKAIQPLINIFGGTEIPIASIENICQKFINQRF